MDFATNFKRICKERGTSPSAVCKALNLSTSKASAWNNGSLPKQPVLVLLAQTLECSVMDFFADEDTKHTPYIIPNEESVLDDDEIDIIKVFRTLPRRDRHAFMAMVYDFEKKKE